MACDVVTHIEQCRRHWSFPPIQFINWIKISSLTRATVTATLLRFDQCRGLQISTKFTVESNKMLQNSQELNSIYFLSWNSCPKKKEANNGDATGRWIHIYFASCQWQSFSTSLQLHCACKRDSTEIFPRSFLNARWHMGVNKGGTYDLEKRMRHVRGQFGKETNEFICQLICHVQTIT